MTRTRTYRAKNELPRSLEETLSSVKDFQGEYEREQDYAKVFEKLKDTNPFSVLVFYEEPKERINLAQRKRLNPNVPERILSGIAEYVQFYFTPELEEMRVGAWIGSGCRSTQSTYALALARLSKKIDVPTHILLYDRQNLVKHIVSSPRLIVQPHEVTPPRVAKNLLRNTAKAYSLGSGGIIEGVLVVKP